MGDESPLGKGRETILENWWLRGEWWGRGSRGGDIDV